MVEGGLDLISMADIARLTGQTRATVGNWKSRNSDDFPTERGRGPRGPLYDRAEVTEWLESTNRLDKRPPEVVAVWQLADQLRGDMTIEEAMPLILVLLAVMSASAPDWKRIREANGNQLDSTLRSSVQSLFPFTEEVMPHGKLSSPSVSKAITTLSSIDSPRVAIMADALLEQAANAMGNRGGEYLSPPSVRQLVVAIAEPVGSVYNPASGVGQLLIDAASTEHSVSKGLIGQEINSRVWAMAQLNLAIHGVKAEIALGDVFEEDRFPDLRADRIVAVPPWGQKLSVADRLMGDPRWVWGEPGANDGNVAWVQHCLYHLTDGGRAVIVLPNSVLFESGRAGRIRQRMVKAGLLDAVLALPPGLFPWTGLACSVLVFVKGRPNVGGKPAPTLMVDISDATESHGGRSSVLPDSLIDDVSQLYRDWVAGVEPSSEYAAVARFSDLAANDFVIDPGRYLAVPEGPSNIDESIRRRSALFASLDSLSDKSRTADDQLKAILGERR